MRKEKTIDKKFFYPLNKRYLSFWIIALSWVILLLIISIVYVYGWIWVVLFTLLIIGSIFVLITQKIIFDKEKIIFATNLAMLNKLKQDSKSEYETIPFRSDGVSRKSVNFKDLVAVEIRDKDNQEKRKYDYGNNIKCIEFLDNNGLSFRLWTKNFSQRQIMNIIYETKKRMSESKKQ